MCPHTGEARQQILELGELDLHLGFRAAGARGEDVENHLRAIHHAHRQGPLEVRPLHRRERLVEQHEGRADLLEQSLQLLDLSLAEIQVGSGSLDSLVGPSDDAGARGVGELAKFVEVGFHLSSVRRALPRRPDEKGPLHGRLNFDERSDASKPPSSNRIYSIKILRPSFT